MKKLILIPLILISFIGSLTAQTDTLFVQVKDTSYFDSLCVDVGCIVLNAETGGYYKIQTDSIPGIVVGNYGILNTECGYAVLIDRPLSPRLFGAKGDDSTNDSPAIQAMFDWGEKMEILHYDLEGRNYYCRETIYLPDTISNSPNILARINIDGNNALLSTDQAITILKRIPVNANDDNRLIDDNTVEIKNVNFYGNSISGSKALRIGAMYSGVIENCTFTQFDTAFIAEFILGSSFVNNRYVQNISNNFIGRNGAAWGEEPSKSSFNANIFLKDRMFYSETAKSGWHLESAEKNVLRNCISEGFTPETEVFISTELSVTKSNKIEWFWSETNADTNTVITWLAGQGSDLFVEGIENVTFDTIVKVIGGAPDKVVWFSDLGIYGNHIFANLDQSGDPTVYGCWWVFQNISDDNNAGLHSYFTNPNQWVGGVFPLNHSNDSYRSGNTGERKLQNRDKFVLNSQYGNIEISNDFNKSSPDIILNAEDTVRLGADANYPMQINASTVDVSGTLQLQSALMDGAGNNGTNGQVLSSTGTGVAWINYDIPSDVETATNANSPLVLSAATDIVKVDASGGNVEIEVPQGSSLTGKQYKFVRIDNSSNTVMITVQSGAIRGAYSLSSQYDNFEIWSDGTDYYVQ